MTIYKKSRLTGEGSVFYWHAVILFVVEFVRGAFLISYLPSYAMDRLHLSITMVGIAVSVHYLADSVVKYVVGYLLDRIQQKIIMQSGHIGLSHSQLSFAFLTGGALAVLLLIPLGKLTDVFGGNGFSPAGSACLPASFAHFLL
jgi:sugar phosphate permease